MAWGVGNSGTSNGEGINRHDALLRVQAPANSVVTIVKGAYHKSDMGHENADDHTIYDYYFIIHRSQFDSVIPWTVTATRGDDSVTETVVINSANEYDVILSYNLVIFDYGQTDYTFSGVKSSSYGAISISVVDDHIAASYRYADTTGTGHGYFYTNETFDITRYSTMRVYGLITSRGTVGVGTTTTSMDAYANGTGSTQEYVIDVSQLSGQHMFRINITSGSSTAYGATIYSIILE